MVKIALVSGGARGIGRAAAEIFTEQGYKVIILDRDAEELNKTCKEINGSTPFHYDVSNEQVMQEISLRVSKEFGRLDCLVNNAGIADFGPIEECDAKKWRTVMETNLDGVFYLSQALTAQLKKTKGSIVNIASISGLRGSTLRVAYGTSKAAVHAITRALAKDLAEYNIRVNAVSPGTIDTPFHAQIKSTKPDVFASWKNNIMLGRLGQPEEVAAVVSFLASENASFITAETIQIGGGQALGI